MDHSTQLGQEKISKLLLKFSIPAVIGMLVNASYNIIDRIFIGRGVGSLALAGVTITFPLITVMMAFSMLIAVGTTALISLRLGENKKEEAEQIMGNGTLLLIGMAIVMSVVGLVFIDPVLKLFGASPNILPFAKDYMQIILYGVIFQVISFGMNNFIRAEGNPSMAMKTMLIAAILNIILDPIFIFGLNMGIKGAAVATIISQAVSATWVLYYFLKGNSSLKIHKENLILKISLVKKILAIGSAPFAMQLAASVIGILLNHSLVYYGGDVAVSAMGIVNSISMILVMPIFGINQGAQPIIGYNYGAKQFDRVKEALKLAIIVASTIVFFGFMLTRLFPEHIITLFNKDDIQLIALGTQAINIFYMAFPIVGFQIVSANYFQAVGKPKHAMLLALSRQVILLIPAVLILPKFFGLTGVFMAMPLADLGSSIITGIWLFIELRQLDQKHAEVLNPQLVK